MGAWPVSYPNVVDVPLCRYELVDGVLAGVLAGSAAAARIRPTSWIISA